jgi:hypothetical protein
MSEFIFYSHLSIAFRRIILWTGLVTQLSAVLHAGSRCSLLGLSAALGVRSLPTFRCPSRSLRTPNAVDSPRRLHRRESTKTYMLDLVSCLNFRNLRLSYRKWSTSEGALFRSESVSLCADSLHAKATEAVKALAAL